jgi:deoxyribonuclease V
MLACVDVHYREATTVAAALLFSDWGDSTAEHELTIELTAAEPYQPGEFYRRELPALLAAISALPELPQVAIIDGYVWLKDEQTPGLGAHLFDALSRKVTVIGVAKTPFRSAVCAKKVLRGSSLSPLYVTAAGIGAEEAAERIQAMHGKFRIPTLLKRVDQLSRGIT